ncbi:MAG TPA: DUF6585 family protein [Pseudonocardiaceae bacterium]|nr:DUF6585 family protein [Pseudonocardiaceae bacterium]
MAANDQLGSFVQRYRSSSRSTWPDVLRPLAGAAMFLFLATAPLKNLAQDMAYAIAFFAVAAVFICLAWLPILNYLRIRNTQIFLYQQGFVYLDKTCTAEPYGWRNIETVKRSVTTYIPGGTIRTYTVQRKDGSQLVLTEAIRHISHLGDAIVQAVTNAQLPITTTTLNEGRRLRFGNLSIDLHEITNGQKRLRWDQVDGIVVHNGYVTVYRKDRPGVWMRQRVGAIPNFPVFIAHAKSLAAQGK